MTKREDFPEQCILVLLSFMAGDRKQTADSDMCLTILKGKGISAQTLEASDPDNKVFRDQLFGISGIRGNYPQVFKLNGGDITFLGDFETIQFMNEDGTLVENATIGADDFGSDQPRKPVRVESVRQNEVDDDEEEDEDEESEDEGDDSGDEEEDERALEELPLDEDAHEADGLLNEEKKEEKKGFMASLFGKRRKKEAVNPADTEDDPNSLSLQVRDDLNKLEAGEEIDQDILNYDESVTAAMRDFEKRNKEEQDQKYRSYVILLSLGICIFFALDIVLVVLIVL